MIGYRTHWYGKEVEGRFTDIETLFIADINALQRIATSKYPAHLYFCSPATSQLIVQDKWDSIFSIISDNTFITIDSFCFM